VSDKLRALVTQLLENNGGPTGGDELEGDTDTHVLVRIEDFKALETYLCKRCGGAGIDTYINSASPTGFTERPCPACQGG
jgi:hypothetical protein